MPAHENFEKVFSFLVNNMTKHENFEKVFFFIQIGNFA